jgi:hypothetical protein
VERTLCLCYSKHIEPFASYQHDKGNNSNFNAVLGLFWSFNLVSFPSPEAKLLFSIIHLAELGIVAQTQDATSGSIAQPLGVLGLDSLLHTHDAVDSSFPSSEDY